VQLAFVVTAQHKPPHSRFEGTIRTYFETKPGLRVPHDQVRLIHVAFCTRFDPGYVSPGVLRTQPIYKCAISFEDQGFVACFTIIQGRVVARRAQIKAPELGCSLVGWNARSRSLVVN
jgi:hypothetical protein